MGHYSPYQTHRLIYTAEPPDSAQVDTLTRVHRSLELLGSLRDQLDSSADTVQFPGSQLAFIPNEEEGNDPDNPFYNIIVDKRIIADHNDLNEPRTLDFIRSMISLTATSAALTIGFEHVSDIRSADCEAFRYGKSTAA